MRTFRICAAGSFFAYRSVIPAQHLQEDLPEGKEPAAERALEKSAAVVAQGLRHGEVQTASPV